MQLTYDLYGSSPIHRAMKKINKIEGESMSDMEHIRTEQILSAKFIVDKIFQNEKNYESEQRTENEQHMIRELVPEFLDCKDKPFPFESISQFFNYFDQYDSQQINNSNFAQFNTDNELDKYLNKKQYIIQTNP